MTMVMMSLRAEASSEARRLADARSHTRDEDDDALAQLEADGPWIVIARRPTRAAAVARLVRGCERPSRGVMFDGDRDSVESVAADTAYARVDRSHPPRHRL